MLCPVCNGQDDVRIGSQLRDVTGLYGDEGGFFQTLDQFLAGAVITKGDEDGLLTEISIAWLRPYCAAAMLLALL